MKALVTGTNGFIGKHLVKYLAKKGFDVCCLVRKESPVSDSNSNNITKHCIDYRNTASLYNEKAFENIDYIFHVAGVTKGSSSSDFYNGNVLPTEQLLRVLKEKNIIPKRFVLISSLAASGPADSFDKPKTEFDDPKPIEQYGKSKLFAENVLREKAENIPFTIIRPAAVYGPGDRDFLNLFSLINKRVNIFYGNRRKVLSIIHVTDLITGIIDAATNESAAGKTYHLANEIVCWQNVHANIISAIGKKPITLNIHSKILNTAGMIGDIYSRITKKTAIINSQKIALSKPTYWTCATHLAKQNFGFSPKISIKEGIPQTLEWYKKHKWM